MYLVFANDAYHSRLEVTADHRVLNVTHDGAQRKVAEWWPKKSCFDSIETQDLEGLIVLYIWIPGGWGVVNASQQGLCVSLGFIGFII